MIARDIFVGEGEDLGGSAFQGEGGEIFSYHVGKKWPGDYVEKGSATSTEELGEGKKILSRPFTGKDCPEPGTGKRKSAEVSPSGREGGGEDHISYFSWQASTSRRLKDSEERASILSNCLLRKKKSSRAFLISKKKKKEGAAGNSSRIYWADPSSNTTPIMINREMEGRMRSFFTAGGKKKMVPNFS